MEQRVIRRGGMLLWAVCGLALAGALALEAYEVLAMRSIACELVPGSSVYGHASWSWLAPGKTCTYALPATPIYVDAPAPARVALVALLAAWPATMSAARQRFS